LASAEDRDRLLELAREVAVEAAELVRTLRREGVHVTGTKSSDIDIVTEADRASERLLHERLLRARPGDGFLGEEGARSESRSGVTWVVDPIDGTVNVLYGIPEYAVSVAATVAGEAVAGVVVNAESGECFTATRGGGAYLDGRRLAVRETVPMSQRLVLTGFNYVQDVRRAQAAAIARMLPQVRDIRRIGSAALDLCAIAAGRADAYLEEGLFPWDMAAGGLVATEAGARLDVLPGAGGGSCVVCTPTEGYDDFVKLAADAGFLR
jgi:myo-inositol-1(or 4)-monophosphatase